MRWLCIRACKVRRLPAVSLDSSYSSFPWVLGKEKGAGRGGEGGFYRRGLVSGFRGIRESFEILLDFGKLHSASFTLTGNHMASFRTN
jgi:hypothetical protein